MKNNARRLKGMEQNLNAHYFLVTYKYCAYTGIRGCSCEEGGVCVVRVNDKNDKMSP